MNYCTTCGKPLKQLKGSVDGWVQRHECPSGHRFVTRCGDPMGGSYDETVEVREWPKESLPPDPPPKQP